MQIKTLSLLPILFAVVLGTLAPQSTALAAKRPAAKAAAQKKAAAAAQKALPALPALAAETALAANPPALPAKAWLLMDYDSGEYSPRPTQTSLCHPHRSPR